jgi:hypothetical protein
MGGVPLNSGSGPSAVFVTAPNDMGLKPGEKADHWYYYGTPLAGEGRLAQGRHGHRLGRRQDDHR